MEFHFVRHGDADPPEGGRSDEERHLTQRGKSETLSLARALYRAGARPEAILTSPLVRARETGQILEGVFGCQTQVAPGLGPGCTLGHLQSAVPPGVSGSLLLVGHEPDFSRIIGQLVGGARVELKKSGAARVDAERLEPGAGVLVWLLSPRLLSAA
jgi:phosphohistidine phosphatase